jgi:uncharacterized protein (TIGR00725 family)
MPVLAGTTIGVIGSGRDAHQDLARELGALLARLGVNLMTGAGRGVMTSVSRAFTRARRTKGVCIGIVPCRSERDRTTPKRGYPNKFIELPIYTHLPYSGDLGRHDLSRNHIIVLSSDAIVALPGKEGTASEVDLALRYRKPIVIYSHDDFSVRLFSSAVPRASKIADVRAFLKRVAR